MTATGGVEAGLSVRYAGFWRRFGALIVDILLLAPFAVFYAWMSNQYRLFPLYNAIPRLLVYAWYNIYLVKKYGGTPGKLLLKVLIKRVDGAPVGYREAILRYSVNLVFSVASAVGAALGAISLSDAEFHSMDMASRVERLAESVPWTDTLVVLSQLWLWSEFVVMFTNNKRRALQDFLAGTVVVCKS